MTDREMLELAAKAAGINIVFFELRGRLACKKLKTGGQPTNGTHLKTTATRCGWR